jgi:branched-chain amino acid transport system ATP-binding protein
MIEIDNVVAGYTAEVDILKGMTLQVQRGEIVTLLGPNGCGKSTLQTIAGFLRPRSGSIVLESKDVSQVPVHQKIQKLGLGFVPQTENVFSSLTIRETCRWAGISCRTPTASSACRAVHAVPGAGRKFNAPASSMSGGERQILALARALMPRPRLLLDEPSAGLSPKMLQEVFKAIVQCATRKA